MSLTEASKLFIEGKSSNTQHTYSSLSKNFSEYLEEKKLSLQTLQPIHVKEFIYQQKAMNSKATYKRFLAAASARAPRARTIAREKVITAKISFTVREG